MQRIRSVFHRKLTLLFVLTGILACLEAPCWAVPLESLIPKKDLPKEWAMVEGPKIFTKKTLFERINGQADLFFKYGFQKSVFAAYQNKKSREDQIEVDIYDMESVLQAFGVFSRFRHEDRPGGFGLDSFLDDHSALFYQGKYFGILHAAQPNQEILRQFSKLISTRISDPSFPPKEISYFPRNGLKPGSIQYYSEGLLGYQFLNRGFHGTYIEKTEVKAEVEDKDRIRTGQEEFKLFLAIFQNPQAANSALKNLRSDLSKKGKVSSESIVGSETGTLKGVDPYQGKVRVVQKGFYLVGIVGFEKEEGGENRLAEFVKNVK